MRSINDMPLPEVYQRMCATGLVRRLLEIARDEDLGVGNGEWGDITSRASISASSPGRADLVAREGGVVAGLAAIPDLIDVFGGEVRLSTVVQDGDRVEAGAKLAIFDGPLQKILQIERTALNLVGRLSGIATLTAAFVEAIANVPGSRARIYDTRKTTPGLRVLEKYAVRCGGGMCHRLGLHDAVLIKDNHIAGVPLWDLGRAVAEAARTARGARPDIAFVEVEVDSLDQLSEILALPVGTVDIVLLDNMDSSMLRRAVQMRDGKGESPELEASGGVRLETVAAIAATGVGRISAGGLTHSVSSLDVALDVDVVGG